MRPLTFITVLLLSGCGFAERQDVQQSAREIASVLSPVLIDGVSRAVTGDINSLDDDLLAAAKAGALDGVVNEVPKALEGIIKDPTNWESYGAGILTLLAGGLTGTGYMYGRRRGQAHEKLARNGA